MKIPKIPCQCCKGKGIQPLPFDYHETLKSVREHPKGTTGEALGLSMKPTARAQQLARLEAWGFVRRIGKQGREIVWQAT